MANTKLEGWRNPYTFRVGDDKELTEWKIKYIVSDLQANSGFENDDWCLGSSEDEFEVTEGSQAFFFGNRSTGNSMSISHLTYDMSHMIS